MFIIFMVTILIVGVYVINDQGVFGSQPQTYESVNVIQGDTVWSIAAEHITAGEDIRDLVHEIRKVNDLDSEVTIYAGQVLKVPV
jgi:LysM repeat protein